MNEQQIGYILNNLTPTTLAAIVADLQNAGLTYTVFCEDAHRALISNVGEEGAETMIDAAGVY